MLWFDFQCHFYLILLFFLFLFYFVSILFQFSFISFLFYFILFFLFSYILFNCFIAHFFTSLLFLCHLVFWQILSLRMWFSYENALRPYLRARINDSLLLDVLNKLMKSSTAQTVGSQWSTTWANSKEKKETIWKCFFFSITRWIER